MNRWLLIWNIILMVLMLVMILGGCSPTDPRIDWLVAQNQSNAVTIAQLQANVDQNRQLIQSQAAQIVALQQYTQTTVQQLQQYIQAYMGSK